MEATDPAWWDEVRARAYALREREGRPEGRAEAHWAEAEAKRLAEGAAGLTDPGDEAVPGTPGTGEDVCRVCDGTGRLDGKPCPNCGGSGKVIEGIGGA